MPETEECCAPVAYIYGGITLSPKPPSQATIGVRVNVGVQNVPVTGPEAGDDYLLWHYVAVVKPGQLKVLCTIGDVSSMKDIEAKPYETCIVNFCFGKPVFTLTARTLKIRARRKEHEKISVKGPTGEGQPGPVS
jgi:hypothetical protein